MHESVDVVIPAYNCEAYVAHSIRSALEQTHPPASVIVVDDGSKDRTAAIVESFGEPVRLVRLPGNCGGNVARNTGVDAGRSEFIAYLDADDAWLPHKLARQLEAMRRDPEVAMCYTSLFDCDEALVPGATPRPFRERRAEHVFDELYLTPFAIPPSTMLIRRSAAVRVGGFDETLRKAQDYEYCLRIAMLFPISCIPEGLCLRRVHAHSITSSTKVRERIRNELAVFDRCAAAAARHGVALPMPPEARKVVNLKRWLGATLDEGHLQEALVYARELVQRGGYGWREFATTLRGLVTSVPRAKLARAVLRRN